MTKTLLLDPSWVIRPMQKGQSAATAPTAVGDWVGFQLNGIGSETPASSIVVANQKDPKKVRIIFPFGELNGAFVVDDTSATFHPLIAWRDAATGRVIAASDFFEPLSINGLTPPGFGGRIYFPTAIGKGFYVLQPMPKPASPRS